MTFWMRHLGLQTSVALSADTAHLCNCGEKGHVVASPVVLLDQLISQIVCFRKARDLL